MTDPRLVRPLWRGRTNVDALTIAALERAESIGGHQFVVTQGSYQRGAGDPLSAGTHDLGGVVDLRWCGHRACLRALREAGFAAWHRTPRQGPWPDHIHAVVLGHPDRTELAYRQAVAFRNGRNGLASNGPDDGPRLDVINPPIFPWPPPKPKRRRPADVIAALKAARLVRDRAKREKRPSLLAKSRAAIAALRKVKPK